MRSAGIGLLFVFVASFVVASQDARPNGGQAPVQTAPAGVSHDAFVALFNGNDPEGAWAKYQTMPADRRAAFDADFAKNSSNDPAKVQGQAQFVRDWSEAFKSMPASQPAAGKTDPAQPPAARPPSVPNIAGDLKDAKKKVDGVKDPFDSRPVPDMPGAGADTSKVGRDESARTDGQAGPAPQRNMAAPPAPVSDTKEVAPAKAKADGSYQVLLKRGLLGAMAGAAIGIGLLPLLGPVGILIGALMGAGLAVAAGMLGGGGGG